MTKYQKLNLLNYLVLIGLIVFGFILKGHLPEIIPTKFAEDGTVLKSAPIIPSIFFLPLIAAFSVWILTLLSKLNKPFWEKEHNREAIVQTNFGIVLLIASLYVGTFLTALNYAKFFSVSYFAIGFGLFFVMSAAPMKKMERNALYGVRVPWTMKSELNWKKTHELMAKILVVIGVLLIVIGLFTKNHLLILGLIAAALLIPTMYSYKIKNIA